MIDPIVARRLNGERLTILSWPRAILLQMAHPLIAAGVARHSSFGGTAATAAARARHTIGAMLALTFGDPGRRDAALGRIRDIHTRINGRLEHAAGPFPAGTVYSAEDPALLLWVHVSLLDSIADIYQRVVAPLSSADLDGFCRESAPTLVALGGRPADAPETWAALQAAMARVLTGGVLAVTPEGRAIAGAVLAPTVGGHRLPGLGLHRLLTIGLLPPPIRQAYGYGWSARDERLFRGVLRADRTARRLTPAAVARWREARRADAAG